MTAGNRVPCYISTQVGAPVTYHIAASSEDAGRNETQRKQGEQKGRGLSHRSTVIDQASTSPPSGRSTGRSTREDDDYQPSEFISEFASVEIADFREIPICPHLRSKQTREPILPKTLLVNAFASLGCPGRTSTALNH